jgi:3-oxoacyl-[acyl-carrier protein] reductase
MGNRLEGRVALVTGSSRGIGAAIARLFSAEGAIVAVHGRDGAAVESVRSGIEASGGRAFGVLAGLTDFNQVEAMRVEIEKTAGQVDLLVANAGASLTPPGPLEEIPVEAWKATVDANLTSTFLTLRSFLPGMKQLGRGDIITISSTAGRRPHSRSPIPYAAAKAGVQLLTQDVALQAGPFGVRANCIAPETILTEDNESRIPSDVQGRLAEAHALRRLGTPDDVARTALFLADRQQSGWMTGVVLDLHGGTQIA